MPRPFVVAIILLGVVALAGTVDRGTFTYRCTVHPGMKIRITVR